MGFPHEFRAVEKITPTAGPWNQRGLVMFACVQHVFKRSVSLATWDGHLKWLKLLRMNLLRLFKLL